MLYPYSRLALALGVLGSAHSALAAEAAWQFDPDLLSGSGISKHTVERFNRPQALLPGTWPMELYVNEAFIARLDITFAENAEGEVQPCIPRDLWLRVGVDAASILETASDCPALSEQVPGSQSTLDPAQLKLSLGVPQSLMRRSPRMAVSLERLNAGDSLLFFNYTANAWHSGNTRGSGQNAGYLSLTGGANWGLWQYRQQGNLSLGGSQGAQWNNQRSYLQRPLPAIAGGSQLLLGQLQTSGRYFSGLSHHGLSMASDERVLADRLRGYAPVVRGVANTNARIEIYQKKQKIYQTTVVPGAFTIDDLAPTSYNGDLDVEIHEADGRVRTFTVPFSALPESLRPGHWRYGLVAGQTRNTATRSTFADATWQYGISNRVSAGGGARLAQGYQAFAVEAVTSGRIGALGMTLNSSRASLPQGIRSGWMAGMNYSRSFVPTNTHVGIAAYRYSSRSYRELGDVLGEREAAKNGNNWQSSSFQQRSRFDLSLSQNVNDFSHLYASASARYWHQSRQHEYQWQLGYGVSWGDGASLNVSLQRLYTLQDAGGHGVRDTQFSMSVSVPLGPSSSRRPSLSSSFSHNLAGAQVDNDVSGSLGEGTYYHLGSSYRYLASSREQHTGWHGSIQQHLSNLDVGLNASRSAHQWQAAANAQGALVVHGGGVTFGPTLGDTFALVEAKGATGASIGGSGQARVDRNGYALVSALTPYRDNRVFLDVQGAADDVELEKGEQHVAPYPGAAVKLKFQTRHGQALLIHVDAPGGEHLPPGTEAWTPEGLPVGMLGQGNWLYLRSEQAQGDLQLRWGERAGEQCELHYDLKDAANGPVRKLHATCRYGKA